MSNYPSQHKGGLRAPFRAFGGPKTSKYKYHLYADGTIFDQETQKVAGYVDDSDIDEAYKLFGPNLQRYLREYLLK